MLALSYSAAGWRRMAGEGRGLCVLSATGGPPPPHAAATAPTYPPGSQTQAPGFGVYGYRHLCVWSFFLNLGFP